MASREIISADTPRTGLANRRNPSQLTPPSGHRWRARVYYRGGVDEAGHRRSERFCVLVETVPRRCAAEPRMEASAARYRLEPLPQSSLRRARACSLKYGSAFGATRRVFFSTCSAQRRRRGRHGRARASRRVPDITHRNAYRVRAACARRPHCSIGQSAVRAAAQG